MVGYLKIFPRYSRVVIKLFQIDAQWRFVLTLFSLSYFISWIIFAIFWYLISYTHGDLIYNSVTGLRLNDGPLCVMGCKSFVDYFLLSVETQVYNIQACILKTIL